MPKIVIHEPALPAAPAPYSTAVRAGNLVFVAGMVDESVPDAAGQTSVILNKMELALSRLDCTLNDLVHVTVFVSDYRHANRVLHTIGERLGAAKPAITVAGHTLARPGAWVEIEAIAAPGTTIERFSLSGIGPAAGSTVTKAGNLVFLSGIGGTDEAGNIVPGGMEAQMPQLIKNLDAALRAAGASTRDIIKTHTTIADWRDYEVYNNQYGEFCGAPYPSRASLLGSLSHQDCLLEITLIAATGGDRTYLDTSRIGWFRPVEGQNVVLDDRLSPGVGPYCQAVAVDDVISVSGMVATGMQGELVGPYDIKAQTTAILDSVNICLEKLGSHRDDVVKTLVTITDWRRMADYNATYGQFFAKPYPARATICGGLAQYGLLIEIEAFAVRGSRNSAQVVVAGPA